VFWNQNIYDQNDPAIYRKVTTMYRNPGYSDNASTIRDDIAVVRLQSDAPVPTQGVLLDSPDTYKGEKLTYVGYGIISSQTSDNDTSGIRRKTEMTLQGCMDPDYYYNNYPCGTVSGDPDYEPQFLFSQESGHNICSGDSGGAAMRHMPNGSYLLVGVNSYTSGSCESGQSGATRIDYYEDWIEGKMGVQLVGTSTPPTDTGSDDTGIDTGGDTGTDDTDDTGIPGDTGLSDDPERPPEGAYDRGFLGLCQVGPSAPAAAWLIGMIGLVPMIRRRRSQA
jgi:MYXO-CTERM domain-containing protein